MATIIKIKRSETAASVPAAGVLDTGEVALNTVDKKIYVKDSGGIVQEVANGIDTLPGLTDVTDGTNGQFLTRIGAGDYQFADVQSLDTLTVTTNAAGSPALAFDGTSVLTYTPPDFEGLSDVDVTTSTSTANMRMISDGDGTYSFVTDTIANLTDVDTTGLAGGDILEWTGTTWAPTAHIELSSVSITTNPAGTPALSFNGVSTFVYTPPNFAGLDDTNITTPTSGQYLEWDGTDWVNVANPVNALSITTNTAGTPALTYDGAGTFTYTPPNFAGLDDTNITTPASGQYLEWDGTDWVNVANPLSTLTVTTAAAGVASLAYDGANTFTYTPPTLADLPDTTFSSLSTGNFMRYDGSVWRNVMINQLTDLTVTTNAPGSPALSFLGTTLTYTPPNFAGLDDTNITTVAADDHLYWNGTDWVNTPMPANVVNNGEVLQYTAGGTWTSEDLYGASSNRIKRTVSGSDIIYTFL